jgi:hypothetical protein
VKLATPSHLSKITGTTVAAEQYKILREQLGVRPLMAAGRIRIYVEVIAQAMAGGADVRLKPALNMGAFGNGQKKERSNNPT